MWTSHVILYWKQSSRIVFAYHISARPAQLEVSERVLGVSEGLEPRAPEISERKVNSTTNTIASEMERRVIHLWNEKEITILFPAYK